MNPGEILVLAFFVGLILWAFSQKSSSPSAASRPVFRSRADVLAAAQAQGYTVVRPDSRFAPDMPIADMLAEARKNERPGPVNERPEYTIVPAKEPGRAVVHVTMPGADRAAPGKPVFEVLTGSGGAAGPANGGNGRPSA
jgi:hypothetical protein